MTMAAIPLKREEEAAKRGGVVLEEEEGAIITSAVPYLVPHGGFWFESELLKSIQLVQAEVTARPDDVILATFPKCGTTWLKALAFAITTRSRHGSSSFAVAEHPLLTRHPQDVVPFLETPFRQHQARRRPDLAGKNDADDDLDSIPSPRLLATHIPLSLLPSSVAAAGCRIVYLCRDPKDVLVSLWHFTSNVGDEFATELSAFFRAFCQGVTVCGPIWDHCLQYWNESRARPDRVLFLRYEEMMSDTVEQVKRLADFLGAPFTDAEESSGVVDQVVRLCSFENLTSLEVNSTGVADRIGGFPMENSTYFRRGKVGDWANYLSAEMAQHLDSIVQEKLKGSGLTF